MFALYGIPSGIEFTYRLFVRLAANSERQLARLAFAHAWGKGDSPDSDFPEEWADALARDPAETAEIAYAANTARREYRVMKKKGWIG